MAPPKDDEKKTDKENWHLDKKVPIAIIVMVITQTLMGVWWVSKLDSRLALVETRTERFWTERDAVRDRLLTLEQQSKTILETLNRIDRRLTPTP